MDDSVSRVCLWCDKVGHWKKECLDLIALFDRERTSMRLRDYICLCELGLGE
jgi:hypothetical protein